MMRNRNAACAALLLLFTSGAALAQSGATPRQARDDDRVRVGVGASLGFLADDPGGVSLGLEVPIEFNRNLSIGPWGTIALADDFFLLSVTANVRYHFDVFEGAKLRRLRPFMQGGMGISYYDDDRADDDETGFLINMGIGADYEATDHVAIGSQIMFNAVPTFRPDRAFYWTWQFIGVRYRF